MINRQVTLKQLKMIKSPPPGEGSLIITKPEKQINNQYLYIAL